MGHARTYLGFDILRRILEQHFHYDVTLIMNITDLDDKIIERSNEQNVHHLALSRQFERDFHADMADLHVRPPTAVTRVIEYMPEIVTYIQNIVTKQQLAYESNGSVYFDVEAFERKPDFYYCKLAPGGSCAFAEEGSSSSQPAQASSSFANEKKSPRDFALWKKSKPGEPQWESPWGPGRPGWHIECRYVSVCVLACDILLFILRVPIVVTV
jgi:cysteinyl-tRNA synthetase